MEFLRGTAGAEDEEKLARFVEKSRQAWLGMMTDEKLVTFEQREQRALDESRLLARLLLEERLARDTAGELEPEGPRACCPRCGQPGEAVMEEPAKPPERAIKTRVGEVRFARVRMRCTTCRVVFFPLGPEAGTGDGGFQSGGDSPGGA